MLSLPSWARRINDWANRHEVLFLFWAIIILLRIPNLAEPYWYGDEAIYLTIGVALKNGAILYKDIVDHKTPLIYYLAMVPNQFWFRILLIVWSLLSTSFFFMLAKRWLSRWSALLATIVFVIFSTLPWLEGHIPNGELFVTGFLLAGMALIAKAGFWQTLEVPGKLRPRWTGKKITALFVGGFIMGLGLLTKVPALLDMGAVGSTVIFAWLAASNKNLKRDLVWMFTAGATLAVGFITPLILSIAYYWLRGAGPDYLDFGLLYNFHYSSNWTLPFTNPALLFLFSLPGKTLVLLSFFVATLVASWKLPKHTLGLWISFWVVAALFGALLSNRPYPHYLIQVIPPAALAIGFLVERRTHWLSRGFILLNAGLVIGATMLLNFGFYKTDVYYSSAWKLLTGEIQPAEYRHSFNYLVAQNEQLVPEIQSLTTPDDKIFIWGTNPMLYAQSHRAPATRFTVAFHIHDLKNYDEMLEQIQTNEPPVIIIMKAEREWEELNQYILEQYIPLIETADMKLYQRRTQPVTWLLQ